MEEEKQIELKKRGRTVPEEIVKKRKNFYEKNIENIVVDGAVVSWKSAIFDELAVICESNVKTEYLAAKTYAEKNDLLQKKFPISDESNDDYSAFEGIEHGSKNYTINIKGMDLFHDREHSKPKLISEFNDALIKIIFENARKPCSWSFGRIFTQDSEVKLHAVCLNNNCNATLVLYTENEQSRMNLKIFNYDHSVSHSMKRYVTDVLEKAKIEALLQIESAMVTRAKLANEYLFENNEYAAHLCSQAALKQRKYRLTSKSYRHDNSTISVQMMKKEPEYMHTIQDIGLDPFFVFFALPLQKEYLLECTRRKRVILSIDATGVSIKPPQNSSVYYNAKGEQYKKSFLYVPVFQIVSQRHSHDFIAYMLHYFKERVLNSKFPSEVIMDDSAALLLANILTFTNAKSMMEYLNQCYDALFGNGEPPKCYVRLDRPHFIKSLNNCKTLNAVDKTKQKFYKRILGYVLLCDNINEVKIIIENVLILLKNEYIYNDRVVQAKNDLEQLVKSHKNIIEENTYDDYTGIQDIEMDQMLDTKTKSKFKKWIEEIENGVDVNFVSHELNNSTEETDSSRNPYVSHQLIKTMSRIFSKVALFSNVMNSVCGSENKSPATSGTEAQFRNMKSFVFNLMKGIRFDKWLKRSIEITKGIFKALISELKETKKSEELIDGQYDDECDYNNPNIKEENWKNQNVDAKKKKNRLHRNPQSILNFEKDEYTTISLLKNGGKSKKCGDTPEIFSVKTCGPDSYFHLFAACYADVPHFKEIIDNDNSHLAEFIRLLALPEATQTYQEEIYAFRNRILLEIFPETVIDIGKTKSIDCECRIADVCSKICQLCSVFYSIQIWPSCCEMFEDTEFIKFNLLGLNLKNIQRSIRPMKCQHRCKYCKITSTATQQPQLIVAFDAENSDRNIALNDIQREIQIGRIPYVLFGVIEHRPMNKPFFAHALRFVGSTAFQWVEYDDLKYNPIEHDNFTADRIVLILYRIKADESQQQMIESKINDENEPLQSDLPSAAELILEADQLLSNIESMIIKKADSNDVNSHAEMSDKKPDKKVSSKRKASALNADELPPKMPLRSQKN